MPLSSVQHRYLTEWDRWAAGWFSLLPPSEDDVLERAMVMKLDREA